MCPGDFLLTRKPLPAIAWSKVFNYFPHGIRSEPAAQPGRIAYVLTNNS